MVFVRVDLVFVRVDLVFVRVGITQFSLGNRVFLLKVLRARRKGRKGIQRKKRARVEKLLEVDNRFNTDHAAQGRPAGGAPTLAGSASPPNPLLHAGGETSGVIS